MESIVGPLITAVTFACSVGAIVIGTILLFRWFRLGGERRRVRARIASISEGWRLALFGDRQDTNGRHLAWVHRLIRMNRVRHDQGVAEWVATTLKAIRHQAWSDPAGADILCDQAQVYLDAVAKVIEGFEAEVIACGTEEQKMAHGALAETSVLRKELLHLLTELSGGRFRLRHIEGPVRKLGNAYLADCTWLSSTPHQVLRHLLRTHRIITEGGIRAAKVTGDKRFLDLVWRSCVQRIRDQRRAFLHFSRRTDMEKVSGATDAESMAAILVAMARIEKYVIPLNAFLDSFAPVRRKGMDPAKELEGLAHCHALIRLVENTLVELIDVHYCAEPSSSHEAVT